MKITIIKSTNYLRKRGYDLLVAFIAASSLLFFAPLSVYLENKDLLKFDFSDIWFIYVLAALIMFLFLLIINKVITPFFYYYPVIITTLCIGFTLEGYFIRHSLGTLNGQLIQWGSHNKEFWIDSLLWLLLIGISYNFREIFYRFRISILIFLFLFQLSTSIINNFKANSNNYNTGDLYLDKEFNFSKYKNVIIVVLDSFRSEAFNTILNKYPGYREVFKDFTFYTNALGGYPTTYVSIPLILSGEFYDGTFPVKDFINSTQSKSLPFILHQQGFVIENYSFAPYYQSIYDNYSLSIPFKVLISYAKEQYLISGIRFMPMILKPFFVSLYYWGEASQHQDLINFRERVGEAKISEVKPLFKFIHLTGVHVPFTLDSNLNNSDKGYIEQAAASLMVVKDMIKELQNIGAYDNSLILILGDHGSGWPVEFEGSFPSYSSQPLVLAKKIDQKNISIQLSKSPVSLMDIPKSILAELDINNNFPGFSIFDEIPTDRVRKWFFYEWGSSHISDVYVTPLFEFEVNGPANQFGSYKLINTNPKSSFDSLKYNYSDNIIATIISNDFNRKLLSNNFSYESNNKEYWSWASGPNACIDLYVEEEESRMILNIDAEPYLANGQLQDQLMIVSIDQKNLGRFYSSDLKEIEITTNLAKEITKDGLIELCFNFPNADKSPHDYKISKDKRLLGYKFTSIIINTK